MIKRVILTTLLSASLAQAGLNNIASIAQITASAHLNPAYSPRFVADNTIPAPHSQRDANHAWCLPQAKSRNAWIDFEWSNPVKIASIVYWGRTAFLDNENFSACSVYINGTASPILTAPLKPGSAPQLINLGSTCLTHHIRLVFPTNYGGSNPGASEIGIFSTVPTQNQLASLSLSSNSFLPQFRSSLSSGKFGFTRIIAVQRHPINSSHVYTYHQEGLKPGGGLWTIDFGGPEPSLHKIVDSPDGEILDASIHYNGKTVLFSWKRAMNDFFQLYTVNIDGSNLKQITDHSSNNFNASFLPDNSIVFLSDRKPAFAYCWRTTTPILWRCDADGSNPIRISSNYLNDFTPSVLSSGRIVYSRWEYVDRPAIPIQSLWTINPDGTKLEGLFGNRSLSPATFMDAREIPGSHGKILCVLTAHNGPCRGAIGIVDPALGGNAQNAITNLTPEINIGLVSAGDGNRVRGPYLNPFPINNSWYLVSKEGTIQIRDYTGSFCQTLLNPASDGGFYNPQPIRERPREMVIASNLDADHLNDNDGWATIIMQDVYHGLEGYVKRDTIKQLAIVQEIEKPLGVDPSLRAFGFQFPVVSCGATYAPKMIWGYADVEKDGSANFKVPARKPIYFLPLDAKGMAVQRMRTFTHLMPGEVQSCVGCHADRNYAMARTTQKSMRRPLAMDRPTQELKKPQWGVHGFSYPHIVQPILDKHCIKCHGSENPSAGLELTADKTDFFNVSYENLARKGTSVQDHCFDGSIGGTYQYSKYTSWISTHNGQEENILEITPGRWGARASLLAHVIDSGHPNKQGKARIHLTSDEARRIYAWIDLNCPYYGTSDSNYMELKGCRRQLPNDFENMFHSIAARRCASCHTQAGKDKNWVFTLKDNFYIRIDNPQKNNFLMAPLAKNSGGSQKCGQAVFKDTRDPDYQKIIAAFNLLQKKLQERPRFDMLGLEDQKPQCRQSIASYVKD